MSRYEALEDLCQSCLHQDWAVDNDGDPWRAVRRFARGAPDLAPKIRQEVEDLLNDATEETLRSQLGEFGCAYDPESDGWSYRAWLTEVADRVDRQLELRGSYTCPICGYPGLDYPARVPPGEGSEEICPSCGFQFGVTDEHRGFGYPQWRQRWVDQGMPWAMARFWPVPDEWDPREQLRRLLENEHGAG